MADCRRNALAYIIELFRRSRLVQRWAPVFIWMAGIFYFSSRPEPLGFLPSPTQRGPVGKVAHFGEYAGLAALLHRALREPRSEGAGERR
jgi:VanZ family protein